MLNGLPLKKRNVARLFEDQSNSDKKLGIWLNANVTKIQYGNDNVQAFAQSMKGDEICVNARKLIIAAGAIETTRLALLIDKQHGYAISKTCSVLGKGFSDHLSTEVAEIDSYIGDELNQFIGFRFEKSGEMRNIRFEMCEKNIARNQIPPHYVHLAFTSESYGGFDYLRNILQKFQMRKIPHLKEVLGLGKHIPWFLRAVYWRFVKKRVLRPDNSKLWVSLVMEQVTSDNNMIKLSKSEKDVFDVPLAEIHWQVSDADISNILAAANLFKDTWSSSDFKSLGQWKGLSENKIREAICSAGGIFHPTGTTRLSSRPEDGVVDEDLKVFGFENIQLLSTSVFPSGGGANPTMMLLLLAMRCLDQHCNAEIVH